jgi:hypothetical protein
MQTEVRVPPTALCCSNRLVIILGKTCDLMSLIIADTANHSHYTGSVFYVLLARYICVMKTNLMHYLSSVYFFNQPLHVSGISVAHHQEVYCMYTTFTNCCIYTVYLLVMGYRYARNMYRLIDEIS